MVSEEIEAAKFSQGPIRTNAVAQRTVAMEVVLMNYWFAYHDKEPPPGWREVTPWNLRQAVWEIPNVILLLD